MKTAISTLAAPQAIGPYSQAIKASGFLFLSGQIPLDPATGNLVDGGISAETRRVLDNIREVLGAAGVGFSDVVKTSIFLTDLADFSTVNTIYAEYFSAPFPARSTIQVAALPKGSRVEIEVVASLAHL
jgi:2-iminobutanoate/2-iminopropanoate deaminase